MNYNNYRYNEPTPAVHATKGVYLREGEDIDSLISRFKRTVKKSGVLDECRKREFYLKKSLKRKMKSKLHMQKMKD